MPSDKKIKSLVDYPGLAKEVIQLSGNMDVSKLAGGLYIIGTPIGHLGDISVRALLTLSSCEVIACEDTRTTGLLLKVYGIKKKLTAVHDHNEMAKIPELISLLKKGSRLALVSDAGMPLIADPGFKLIRACQDNGLPVFVIPGANAALTGLIASGLSTDSFFFGGFLPNKTAARQKKLFSLKSIPSTLIFYESPQRLLESLKDCIAIFGAAHPAAIARELTKLHEEVKRGPLEQLVSYFSSKPIKGEIVILLAPPDTESTANAHDLDEMLKEALRQKSLRDAVLEVSLTTGLKRNEVYARALWITQHFSLTPKKKSLLLSTKDE